MNEKTFQRFAFKVSLAENGCAPWVASRSKDGYGQFTYLGINGTAHKAAYRMFVGEVPEGLVLDHLCRNRACVNPEHLEPVTQGENVRRGETGESRAAQQLAKTHCPQGHSYSGDNLYTYKTFRYCKTCIKTRDRLRPSRSKRSS